MTLIGSKSGGKPNKAAGIQQPLVLYATSIICGAILMALEVIGGRLLSPYFGSSVYVWGSIITVFLVALSVGYLLGGIAADKRPSGALLAAYIAVSGLLILPIPLLVFPLVKFTFTAGLGNLGALVVGMLLFFLPSLGLGMVSPYIVKLGTRETSRLGNYVGRFYAVSTLGSILGTLATTFLLIPSYGVRSIIFALGILLVVLAVILLILMRLLPQGIFAVCLLLAAVYGLVLPHPVTADDFQYRHLIHQKDSMYNNISVKDEGNYRYLMFDDIDQSAVNKNDPDEHVWPYTRLMVEASEKYRPEATDFLAIGVGGGIVVRDLLAKKDRISFDAVDIDPEVIRIAHDYFGMPRDSRLQATAADGRVFLRDKKSRYDIIMIDAYDRLSIPYHLTTREFFEEVADSLKPGGIVMFNVIGAVEGNYSPLFKSFWKTTKLVFPETLLFQTETTVPEQMDNLVIIAAKEALPPPGQLAGLTEYGSTVDLSEAVILTDDYAPVEALAENVMSTF